MANKITRRRLVDQAIKSNNLAVQSGLIISELMKNRDEMNKLVDAMILDMYGYEETSKHSVAIHAARERHAQKEKEWNNETT